MRFEEFLERVIDDGIEAAKADYTEPAQASKLDGSIAGFEACRGKDMLGLGLLLKEAHEKTREAFRDVHEGRIDSDVYWFNQCYELEVEWVCNCASACLANQGLPVIVPPTCRGVMKAAEILGVGDVGH
jgi:hypothetical protein